MGGEGLRGVTLFDDQVDESAVVKAQGRGEEAKGEEGDLVSLEALGQREGVEKVAGEGGWMGQEKRGVGGRLKSGKGRGGDEGVVEVGSRKGVGRRDARGEEVRRGEGAGRWDEEGLRGWLVGSGGLRRLRNGHRRPHQRRPG